MIWVNFAFVKKMLKIALGAFVKRIRIEILHWKIVKSDEFNFLLKNKNIVEFNTNLLLLISLSCNIPPLLKVDVNPGRSIINILQNSKNAWIKNTYR